MCTLMYYTYIRVRAPERLISFLSALGRGRRRRRRVLCVCVCVFVRRVGRRRAGRDPPTKETLRFCLLGWVAAGPRNDSPLQNCSEITFGRKKTFKNEGLAVFCPKNILFCNAFFKNHSSLFGFSHMFENRSNIHLTILLKVILKVLMKVM